MGALAIGALAVGAAAAAGGGYLSAQGGKKQAAKLLDAQNKWLPTFDNSKYFSDLSSFAPESMDLANKVNQNSFDQALKFREEALPGSQAGLQAGSKGVFDLMQGKLPEGVWRNFMRSGGASSVGKGWGGSGFGDLTTGLFGAEGSLKGMQIGFSLLPTLFGVGIPNAPVMAPWAALQNIATPAQMAQTQLGVRGQNLGLQTAAAGIPNSSQTWGSTLGSIGGALMGAGATGMMGGGMGGAGAGSGGKVTYNDGPYGVGSPGRGASGWGITDY